jgi:acyl-homoserine-lactone acylase
MLTKSLAPGSGLLIVLALLAACVATPTDEAGPTYEARLYRSEGGIPHVIAPDFASLAYGTAYAAAEDNICYLARHFLKLRGRLSEHFGPDDGNLQSDLFYQLMKDEGQFSQSADPEFEALFRGYADGYNRYLRDTGADNLNDATCRGAEWVRQISAQDSRNVHLNPFFIAAFMPMVVSAKPPDVESRAQLETSFRLPPFAPGGNPGNPTDKGSNGVAIGRQGAASGNALLFANPHLDWRPDQRFYPMHQIIPGELNLLGANQVDRASVGFGTNGHIAWTNTVSTAMRFSFYQLTLAPGDPTSYLFDGKPRQMQRRVVIVPVRNPDGSVGERSQTFYSTHFGHVIGQFPWNENVAFALRIADEMNRAVDGATIKSYQARTVRELKAIHDRYQYISANLIAADSSGEVLYGDFGAVVNLSDRQLADCSVMGGQALDGSRSECQWMNDPAAAGEGILPPRLRPSLIRDDFVTNSNDSYWLANPEQPITGLPKILGKIRTERTLRTRSGLQMVMMRLEGTDGRPGKGFSLESLIDVLMSNQNMSGSLLRDDLVTLCRENSEVTLDNGDVVSLGSACDVLADWDLRANADSRGAHLFREFMREANRLAGPTDWPRILPASLNYRVPFHVEGPLDGPAGLDTDDNPNALIALAAAIAKLEAAGIELDARLGDIQGVTRNSEFIPVPGGPEFEGVFNKMEFDFAGAEGYPEVTGSSGSWIMATELRDDGPRAKGILTYSISGNPDSPHYDDMTRRLSEVRFYDLPYTEAEVLAAALHEVVLNEGVSDCRDGGWQRYSIPTFEDEQQCVGYFEALAAKRLTRFVTKQRLLPLSGARNARDLGGYTTADGRNVKWGMLFRADGLDRLTDDDVALLGKLQLAAVTDFRSDSERDGAPDRLPQQSPPVDYRTLAINDAAMNVAELGGRVLSGQLSETELLALTDRRPYIQKEEISRRWGQWVTDLADPENLPHLFHCTAGKDRTGFAAALVLLALGVSEEQVMQDFLLSNDYLGAKVDADIETIRAHSEHEVGDNVLRQVLGVSPQSLEGAIEAMEAKYGSIDGFIEQGLGIDAATRTRLQDLLLE